MLADKYKKFVMNYEPFEWEMEFNPSEFRENIKGKHSSIISFIRFYKVFLYLEKLKEDNLKNPKIFKIFGSLCLLARLPRVLTGVVIVLFISQ